jgi:hypothetical protein
LTPMMKMNTVSGYRRVPALALPLSSVPLSPIILAQILYQTLVINQTVICHF